MREIIYNHFLVTGVH